MVLHQVRDTITMKVQFNPVEYHHSGKIYASDCLLCKGSVLKKIKATYIFHLIIFCFPHYPVNLRSSSSVGGSGSVTGTASQSSDGGMDGAGGSRGNCSNRSSTDEGLEEDDDNEDDGDNDIQSSDESLSGII